MIQGLIYSVISAIAFGMLVIFAKLGYRAGLDAVTMLQYRFTFGVAIMFLYLFFHDRSQLSARPKTIARCAFIGLFIYPIQSIFFVASARYIPASTTALIFYFYPVAVTLLSAMFLGMKINRIMLISIALVLGGCGLVFYDAFLQQMHMGGVLLATGSMAVFSVYLILVQRLLKDEEPLRATLYILFFASLSYNAYSGFSAYVNMSRDALFIGLGLGLIASVVAMIFLYLSIKIVGSVYTSIFSSIEPVATLVAAAWLLEEKIVMLQVFGVVLIIAGVILPNLRLLFLRRQMHP